MKTDLISRRGAHLKIESENWKRLTDVVGLILMGTPEEVS
jgi:hypothetical protein